MASFYFDRFSHEPYNEQLTRYLQTGAHVRDLQLTVEAQTLGIQVGRRSIVRTSTFKSNVKFMLIIGIEGNIKKETLS